MLGFLYFTFNWNDGNTQGYTKRLRSIEGDINTRLAAKSCCCGNRRRIEDRAYFVTVGWLCDLNRPEK
jgi:hypothetical protein